MRVRIETKSVPSAAINKKAQEQADEIERITGRKPGRKEMKALKEDARTSLLPMAFPRISDVWVWIDLGTERVIIDSVSQSKIDEVVTTLVRAMPDFPIAQLFTVTTAASAMTQWLAAKDPDEWPDNLSVERECELKSCSEDKATVRFTHHHPCARGECERAAAPPPQGALRAPHGREGIPRQRPVPLPRHRQQGAPGALIHHQPGRTP